MKRPVTVPVRQAAPGAGLFTGLVLCIAVALFSPACTSRPGEVAGKITFREAEVEGVAVEVYLKGDRGGGAPFAAAESTTGGRFSLSLPPGDYWIWAKEAAPAFGPRKIAEYEGNPVSVRPGEVTALGAIELRPVGSADQDPAPSGAGIRGKVLLGGTGVGEAAVTIYKGAREVLTGPGYVAVVRTDGDGSFQADLGPGEYRVAVRKRKDGTAAGFLRPGDHSAEYGGNPVRVEEGSYTDLASITLHEVDSERLAAAAEDRSAARSSTRLAGRVVDGEGKPLGGQFVFVYKDQGMIGRPHQLTTSDSEGGFVLNLAGGGTYYIGARERFGGPREPGELVGRLADPPDSSVEVAEGAAVEGLAIVMEEMW